MTQEALKLALDFIEDVNFGEWRGTTERQEKVITAIKEALAQPEQEPVAWADHGVVNWIADKQFKHASLLYTHPPQRTWIGLAAEDRLTAKYMQDAPDGIEAVIDYLEAKLKQKNGYAEEKNT